MGGEAREPAIAGGARVLVLANDDGARWRGLLADTELSPTTLRDAATAKEVLAGGRMDVFVISGDLASAPPLGVLEEVTRLFPDVPVLLCVDPDDVSAAQAGALGAAGVVAALPTAESLRYAIRAALTLSYAVEPDPVTPDAHDPREILLGESPAMKRVHDLIDKAARGIATILIRGETGTGKELVAKAVHAASDRARGPMVTIHCGALPDNLLESELFGYEKGAFTGAEGKKRGRVELAEGGTLFLDEIGDVTPAAQVKLLRLLQDRTYERLGGNETLHADVRFVAATHRDLDGMVKAGTFREDLFYRLNVVPLWVPPLRGRKGDLRLLARFFCDVFAQANGRANTSLSDAALERIARERWPGNVRQLQNLVERLVVLHGGRAIEAADVDEELQGGSPFSTLSESASRSISISSSGPAEVVELGEAVKKAEHKAIQIALLAAKGNRSQAARLLGVSRATFYNKLKEHDLP